MHYRICSLYAIPVPHILASRLTVTELAYQFSAAEPNPSFDMGWDRALYSEIPPLHYFVGRLINACRSYAAGAVSVKRSPTMIGLWIKHTASLSPQNTRL